MGKNVEGTCAFFDFFFFFNWTFFLKQHQQQTLDVRESCDILKIQNMKAMHKQIDLICAPFVLFHSFLYFRCCLLLSMRWVEWQWLLYNVKCMRWLLTACHSYLTITSDLLWLLLSFCQFLCYFMVDISTPNTSHIYCMPVHFLINVPEVIEHISAAPREYYELRYEWIYVTVRKVKIDEISDTLFNDLFWNSPFKIFCNSNTAARVFFSSNWVHFTPAIF